MNTVIITLLCCLIAVFIFERAYRIAKRHVSLQHRNNVLEDVYKEATDHIAEQEKYLITLQQELDYIRRTEEDQTKRERPRSWDPNNLMNLGERRNERM